MENKEIVIDLSSEYKVKIESVDEFETSIFKEVYDSAKENVLEILKHTDDKKSYDSYNNIIAFTGERGKGKSSAMISFLECLKGIKKGSHDVAFLDSFYDDNYNNTPKNHFIALDVIDPSLFRGNETLFEIVLAKMFSKFKKSIENENGINSISITDEKRRQLVKLFQNVFENLKYTNGNNKNELYKQEALDALIKLSTSSNLRESFNELVKSYLEVISPNSDTKNILVITIDDFDLKTEGVYEMLEDVRQFLITENVIVLMACKMEQMLETIEITISKHFNNQFQTNHSYEIDIKNKARRYIEKLFPISRQITLPNTESINLNDILKNTLSEKNDLKILEVIFNKKNVFYSSDNYLNHLIYDDTLRSLINLFHSLKSSGFNQFFKYCEIRFAEFLEQEKVALIMNCDYVLLNTFILKILEEEFNGSIKKNDLNELSQLSASSNYEIIQNADINAFLYVISKSLNINNPGFKKIKVIATIYNLRNTLYLNSDLNSIKLKSLSGILNVSYIDPKNRIPHNAYNRKYRDYFKVQHTIKTENFTKDQLVVISAFVQNLGDSDNINKDGNIFIKEKSTLHKNYYFSIFTFINAPKNISKLVGRFKIEHEEFTKLEELEEEWMDSYYGKLFSSNDFVIEFYEYLVESYRFLSKSSKIKSGSNQNENQNQNEDEDEDKDEDLHANLILLFSEGIKQVFKKFNEKYKYLNLNFQNYLNENIILKTFLDKPNDPNIKSFINESFENSKSFHSTSIVSSLNKIHKVNNVEPLKQILNFFETSERKTKNKVTALINEVDDLNLKQFLLEKKYFEGLFSTSKNKKLKERNDLKKHLKRIIDNGQPQE